MVRAKQKQERKKDRLVQADFAQKSGSESTVRGICSRNFDTGLSEMKTTPSGSMGLLVAKLLRELVNHIG